MGSTIISLVVEVQTIKLIHKSTKLSVLSLEKAHCQNLALLHMEPTLGQIWQINQMIYLNVGSGLEMFIGVTDHTGVDKILFGVAEE
jgi:hypothetical protein